MPFIGKQPEVGAYQLIDSITTSATATYALTVDGSAYFPASARNLIVSLNGVTQAPESAYTVSGSNIVFASALTASDVIDYILVIGDAVDIGTPSDGTVGTSQMSYPLGNFSSTGIDDNATSTAITITGTGRVGIDNTNPSLFPSEQQHLVVGDGSGNVGATIYSGTTGRGNLKFADGTGFSASIKGAISYDHNTDSLSLTSNELVALTIDSSQKVGIGHSNPVAKLAILGSSNNTISEANANLCVEGGGGNGIIFGTQASSPYGSYIQSGFVSNLSLATYDLLINPLGGNLLHGTSTRSSGGAVTSVQARAASVYHQFSNTGTSNHAVLGVGTSGFEFYTATGAIGSETFTERMRITSGGSLLVGQTNASNVVDGAYIRTIGSGLVATSTTCLTLNRQGTDGTVVDIKQANISEGTISVSGTTVSYNGGHLSRWSQSDIDDVSTIYKGTVMSNLDAMCEWGKEDNEQLNKTKISDVEGDINVAGVFVAEDNSDDLSDYYLAMTGDMIIRIAQGTTVQRGDLLMSAGDGTAKPQEDDIVRSKTIAKVISTNITCTYADGSYCVPCVLMAC